MRIDSAILSNAIITASAENPIVSGSSQVNITQTTGYSTFSSSIQTYTDAKVSALVESAPGTLDTLNELAAALGDDANLSASIATTIGDKLATSTHTAFSSSNASALRAEYVASTSALSASAHTRREQISASLDATIDALDSLGISTDTERGALSSSAHTQREAIKGLATTANNSLSSSTATALRSEYVAGDSALSSSAHTQREAIKGLATSANNSLSSSTATALRAEYVAADGAFLTSASIGATINDNAVKLSGIESGADVTDATNVTAAGALMDSEVTDLAGIKGVTISTLQVKPSEGAFDDGDKTKLDGIESGATADQSNAEIRAAVEAASDSNVFTDADHSKLNGIEASATADQTASEILTAIKTVDGTGSGLDADTLDGQEGAYYAPSASMKTYVDAKVAGVVDTAPAALDTLNELAAALGDDANFATTTATSIGTKLAKASNLSDLENAGTARSNLGVDAAGTVNYTHPTFNGDDFSVDTGALTGATVVSDIDINVTTNTDGHVTDANGSVSTRELTLADLGFTGASNANYITNNNQLTNGAGYITSFTNTVDMGDGFKIASSDGTDQFTVTENEEIRFAGSGATSVSFDSSTQKVTISSTDNNTTYSVGDGGLTQNNFTNTLKSKLDGIASGATNVTNNNQLTNGAGYTTYTSNQTLNNNSNVHFEGLMIGQTSGATANTIRCVGDIVAYYSDDRLKNKIGNLEGALDKVNSLNGFTYTPNEKALALGVDQDEVRVGVSAQEVQAVLPEAVKDAPVENTEGYLTVQYEKIVPLLIESIKELSAKVEELSK